MLDLKAGDHVGLTRGKRRMSWGGESPSVWLLRVRVKGSSCTSKDLQKRWATDDTSHLFNPDCTIDLLRIPSTNELPSLE